MKNLQTFSEFVNESEVINEGLTSDIFKIAKKDKTVLGLECDSAYNIYKKPIEKILGAKEKDIIQVDEYSAEEYPEIAEAYEFLQNNFNGTQDIPGIDEIFTYDPKLNCVGGYDMGFYSYQITKKSKL